MPQREARDDQDRALDVYIKLRRAVNMLGTLEAEIFRPAGLTESQFGALEALLHKGPMCQKELAGKILKSTANLTTVIDNLERRGLVRRMRSSEDRRVVTVHLSDSGRHLIEEVLPLNATVISGAFSVLSGEEQIQLAALCHKLSRQLGR